MTLFATICGLLRVGITTLTIIWLVSFTIANFLGSDQDVMIDRVEVIANYSLPMPVCPNCASCKTVKNGRIHNGKQQFKCHECGRQFVEHSPKKVIDLGTRELIDQLLLSRISLAGIARATQVSEPGLKTT